MPTHPEAAPGDPRLRGGQAQHRFEEDRFEAPRPTVRLPPDPTGPALASVVRQLRAAARPGQLVVDLTATRHTSPGLRRALAVLRGEAARRGCSWTVRGNLPHPARPRPPGARP
ncbi:hypothetical protein [Kineococcus aurantiacus]|uniref:STAS domain-containing protein n=1 Tax=Kineococcus aurantiacus TaxID=37633 RepID=A0A7Y9J358_9ACTN|nr:hypothetical protein [Kineococcus aurantiacus]NYD24800.1 hypothetical protein [Kineococcus aurantiacus]